MRNADRPFSRYAPGRRSRRILRPSDFGIGMTVCIASIAEDGRRIVVATDQMASMSTVSADHAMVKADFLGATWLTMWSGDDISPIPAILANTRDQLNERHRQGEVWPAETVASALSAAYQKENLRRVTVEYLSPFDLDMPQFLANGLNIFEKDYFARLHQIEDFDLGVTFLVVGYEGLTPWIFTVGRRGLVHYFNKPGFWAIGSGDHLAMGALALRQHNTTKTTSETIYAVLEAKMAAELAMGVGKHTTVGVVNPTTLIGVSLMELRDISALRTLWEAHGAPVLHADVLLAIHSWWGPHEAAIHNARADSLKRTLQARAQAQATPQVPPTPKRGRKARPPSRE